MTTENIFTGQDQAQDSETPPKTQGSGEKIVTALVGEGQKYKTVDDLAKAYLHADTFIQQLKEENQKYREQVAAAKSIDDVLERMEHSRQQERHTPAPGEPDISAIVEQTLVAREAKKTQEANLLEADRLMKERHGERATELFKAKASTPELKKLYMELAARSPQDFVALFGEAQPPTAGAMQSGSTVNAVNIPSTSANRANIEGTKEWFTRMRKEEPQKFYSSTMQVRFSKAATENPKLYFG